MVRHVKLIIISYQWLNVETREHLFPVRKCRDKWRGTAAHGLLKCTGPKFWTIFFQNWFHVLHIIFLNFLREYMNIFLSFVPIQVLIDFSGFNGFAHIFTVSRARSSWPRGCYPTGRICSNGFPTLGIISDVMNDYSTRRVWKRKYLRYFNRHLCCNILLLSWEFSLNSLNCGEFTSNFLAVIFTVENLLWTFLQIFYPSSYVTENFIAVIIFLCRIYLGLIFCDESSPSGEFIDRVFQGLVK